MSVLRSRKDRENPYVQINRKMFDDPNLSMRTKGFIGYCLSKPDEWKFYIEQLASVLKEKKTALYAAIKEAEREGYCIKYQHRLENGRMGKFEYIISDSKEEIARLKEELNIQTKAKPENEKSERKTEVKKCLPLSVFPLAESPLPENQPLTINNDKEERYKEDDINVSDYRSSHTLDSIVPFDPETYVLPNGEKLSLKMRRSLAKYSGKDRQKLHANVAYFHEQIAKGKKWDNPEAYLQSCIKNNYAQSANNAWQNKLYATWMKEEHQMSSLTILKTVVQMKKNSSEPADSLSFSLSQEAFSEALDNFIRNHKE